MGRFMGKKLNGKTGTTTSTYGSPSRINHDSSKFYNSKLYEGLQLNNILK